MLSSLITFGPQPNKAIVGRNAFAHEAGIHQDGYLKEKTTYEIIDPRSVGVPEGRLVLGKHSGRHALHQRCQELGYELNKEELDDAVPPFHGGGRPSQEGPHGRGDRGADFAEGTGHAAWRRTSSDMDLNVLVLPGDGIGTEVTREAVRVLRHVAASGATSCI